MDQGVFCSVKVGKVKCVLLAFLGEWGIIGGFEYVAGGKFFGAKYFGKFTYGVLAEQEGEMAATGLDVRGQVLQTFDHELNAIHGLIGVCVGDLGLCEYEYRKYGATSITSDLCGCLEGAIIGEAKVAVKYVDHVAHSTLVTLSRMGVGLGEYKALGLGFLLALSDVFNFSIVKMLRTGQLKNMALMAIPTTVYALQPWIVYFSLSFSTLTVMNLLRDLS